MTPTILVSCFSVAENTPSHYDWPPLHYHRIVTMGAVHVTKKLTVSSFVSASADASHEYVLLGDLAKFCSSHGRDATLVTMFGKSYAIPLILQRCLVHKVQTPFLFDTLKGTTPVVDLLDLLTYNGTVRMPKTDEALTELLGIEGPHKPDIEKLASSQKFRKKLKREQTFFLAKLLLLWVRQCQVGGMSGKDARMILEGACTSLSMQKINWKEKLNNILIKH